MLRWLNHLVAFVFGRGAAVRKPVVEEIEPRILYSADVNPLLWGGVDPNATAIVAAVDIGDGSTSQQTVDAAQQQRRREIVFVDAAVPDGQALIDAIVAQRGASADIEVVQLRADADGLAQIDAVLAGERDLDAIHIVSHGDAGRLQLGSTLADEAALLARADSLAAWSAALGADADILLFGCNVGAGADGEAFIARLAALTGADVAASVDATGSAAQGGDWDLELRSGAIETPVALVAPVQWSHVLAITTGNTSSAMTTGASSLTFAHTIGSGSNGLLVVNVASQSASVSSVTYNGTALTFLGVAQNGTSARTEMWYLKAPAAGTANVVITMSASAEFTGGAANFFGVDQTTPTGAFTAATGGAHAPAVTVASAAGELVIDSVSVRDGNFTATGAGQTTLFTQDTGGGGGTVLGVGSREAGAASVTMDWSLSGAGSGAWAAGAVSLKAAATAIVTVTPTSGLVTTEAGGTAQFSVVLSQAPTADVTISISSGDTTEGTVSTSSLLFTTANWNVAQTVTVTGVNDTLDDGNIAFNIVTGLAVSSDAAYSGLAVSDVAVSNTDDDTYNTVVVTNTTDTVNGSTASIAALIANDGGDGISLREAITAANNTANGVGGADRIHFNIALTNANHLYYRNNAVAGTFSAPVATTLADAAILDFDADYAAGTARSWYRITLGASDLNVTQAVIIDGSTQAGYDASKGPIIEIDASGVTAGDPNALTLTSGASTVRGLVIHSADDNAIEVDVNADGSVIAGNYLGTDVSGTKALGNSSDGPYGALGIKADGVIVGGTTVADRNLFSGNLGYGIEIYSSATGAVIRGNTIGTTVDGSAALGNAAGGIYIWDSAANNTIGGAAANQGNLIASNGGDGVWVGATAGAGNAILGNTIYSNTGLAIDLGANGVTANDTNDGDSGANDLLNFPVVTKVVQNGANLDVTLVLDVPAGNYRIELYQNPAGIDATRYGEGQVFLGALSVTSTGGAQTYTGTLNNVTATSITRISATATRDLGAGSYGNTSEFGPRAGLVVSTTADTMDGTTTSVAALILNPGVDGQISLREAITAANASAGTDYIYFDITAALAGGVHTITLAYDGADAGTTPDALPTITSPVVINGWTEPDYTGNPIIELNGNGVAATKGLTLGAGSDGSTIRGLIINRFTGTGIEISGSNNHTIQGNWIGLNAAGTAASANGIKGIYALNSSGLLIGGTTAAERNVVSGNAEQGIYFDNTDNSTISGNYVGTNAAGTGDVNGTVSNSLQSGVFLTNGSSGNMVGGTTAGARNVLSGNNHFGFEVLFGSQNNLLQGNYIGTDVSGLVALGNISGGATFWNAGTGNVFGGGTAGARNVIAGNTFNGVLVGNASTGATIQGNYIGVGADGVTVVGNGSNGIRVEGASTNTRIGTDANGTNDANERNVISGNSNGVSVTDAGTMGTVIAGNVIGLAADGNTIAANSSQGVSVVGNAGGVTIGGATSVSRNVISGNASFGIYLGSTTSGSSVLNNYIGTNAAGTAARANLDGVWIDGSANNTIGQAGAGNVIAGSTYYGVVVDAAASTGNTIRANLIGTDAAGTGDLGNGAQGILVSNGASATAIGGTAAGQGNTIAFNDGDGIHVAAGTGVSMLGNAIHSNTDLGIDLGAGGVTANDTGDGDTGANNLQNFAVLTLARTNGSNQLTLSGTLNSSANSYYRIEFFASTAQDGTGHGEAQTYIGFVNVPTDGSGNATISTTLTVSLPVGTFVSATATRATDNTYSVFTDTSELARNVYALPIVQGALVVDTTNDVVDGDATSISTLLANKGADGFISLREAVIASNNTSGNDTLNLAAGTYTLTIAGAGEDGSATGDIDVQTNITIAGAGVTSTIISGGGIDRAIEVDGSGNLTLSDVRLTGGLINNDGGALLVEEAGGTATLTRVDITGNAITGGGRIGGGIHNVGTLVMTDSLVHGNTATGSDGGGVSNLGTATITRSSIYANSARYGGGIHQLAGSMTIENLTISGNTASAEGGGIDVAAGTLIVKFTTVAANTAVGGNGGGVMVRAGALTIGSSIFADNTSASGGRDLHGTVTSLGFNVIEHNAGFSGTVATDLLGVDPALAALALDAASGQYLHALNAGSIAIDLGGVAPPPTDQRNAARDGSADAGAYERLNSAPVLDVSGTMTFPTITEDDTNNAGQLVSTLIASAGGDRITDADGDPEGIAITATASGNGSWEYSLDGGGSWYTIGAVTNASALLLRSSDRVRFVPNANDGTTGSITFRAWDRKIGAAGTKVTTATNGGSSAFSAATEDASITVTAVNDAPTGAPVVTGTATEDQTLTANTASIADADGLGAFSYQWQRNGSNIAGATASTYLLGDADVGASIRVVVSYTDARGTAESLTSAAIGPVANVNDAPSGAPVVTGTASEDQTLTANTASIADADGLGAFGYQWQRNGSNIAGATASTYTLGDADVGANMRVVVSYTDAHGTAESLTSGAVGPVTNANDAPTGAPVVTGTATEDQTLTANTASIADADGLGAFGYQWQRNGSNIAGATASTYTLGDADVGANMRVVVSYTDAHGTAESLTSGAVGPVTNANDAPTGAPVVTGTATEDQTLTANTASIADADGLGAFGYQWQRNGSNIAGATASTYTLGDADVGANMRVVVSYTDAHGTAESLTSGAVGPVTNANDAPTGAPVVTGTATEDQTLTANTASIADADGLGAFGYQWQRNGSNVVGATASTYTLGDADVGASIRVVVSYTDGNGTAESLTSAAVGPIANVNDAPSGAPLVTGTATEDQTLAADTSAIADADGLGSFSYQWQRNGSNVGGATASTYLLGDADVGANIRVVVSYTDARGTAESLTSAAIGPVANVNDAPSGAPVVTGTATEDQTLTANTASIADADGLGAFGYQWQRNGVNIAGATASSYLLGDADVGTNIRVVVSYTDARGTAESLASAAAGPVANVNDAPSGAPVVTGTATEDQTLSADTSAIADADGLGSLSYQWQRNGVAIGGATGSTYTLGNTDVGASIRVIVSYTDGNGTAESLTSAAVGPVANVNDAPSGAPVVTGTTTEDQTLTADTAGIADADGLGAFSYQWQRNGVNIAGATASSYLLGDADVGTSIRVVVSYTDGNGTAESLTSAAVGPVSNANDAPTGAPVVTGTATEDQTLTANTASIADADGLGAFSYQWQRNGVNVAGATASSYLLGDADVGTNIRVVVSYTDARGTAESLTSAAVGPIANVNDAPSGTPVVTGMATEDQTLTADTSLIADADGLGAFSYQWQRNGSSIAGATGSTYLLGDADVGANMRVVVSWTDGNGTAESLTSAAVGPVANVNDAPSGAATINDTTPTQGQTLVASNTLADADGLGVITYTWQADGSTVGTGSTYVVTEAEVGKVITVIASYADGHGTAEVVTSVATAAVANINDAPTGSVTIDDTTPTQGQTLTASNALADADGLGVITYTWQANGATVGTGGTYVVTEAEVGKVITVIASYTDGHGTAEAVSTAATAAVANVNDAPTGSVTIDDTTPTQGQTLTASNTLADADGLGVITYTWQANGATVGTGSTYVVTEAEVGKVITVIASYTDGHGTAEAVISVATAAVANINDAPTGTVTIDDTTPTQGQTLTVSNTLADADGLGAITYTWQADGASVGTGSTYVVTEAEVGKVISVVASYTDGHGTSESVSSAATAAVANVNDAPTGSVTVDDTTPTQGQTLTASNTLADADGLGVITYTWQADGATVGIGNTYIVTQAEVGKVITVIASYTDGHGTSESIASAATAAVANVNDAPTGAPVVIGTPTEDQTLTADPSAIADADGLGAFSYQWQRNGSNVAGATSSAYTLGDADVGANIRVVVSYTDARGTAESLTSAAVGPVANVNDAPSGAPVVTGAAAEDQTLTADTSSIADADGLGAFSYQWQRNGSNIAGASASTYLLGDADVGANIRVVVSYTDARGTAESLTSAAFGPVANVNDAPSGAPVVSGTATEDQTLTADTSSIADADGLTAFSYQWQRDGVAIAGATASTHTLGDADVGASIRVVVSYTDGNGTAENLTSTAVGPVANVNDAPSGAPVVTGTATEDQTLSADTSSIADADGLGALSYQWQRNGVNIGGASGSTYVLGDADVGTTIRVVVSYTDGQGTAESLTSVAVGPIANVNDAPSGAPVVTGAATEDQTLGADTSSIADADGLGAFSYQWQRNGVNIGGATGSTYVLGDADVGTTIRVVVSYTDGGGTAESMTSAAVGPVANVNDAPSGAPLVIGTPTEDQTLSADTSTIADADGLGAFSYQWQRNGVNIAGAIGSTYTLGDADVGASVRVVVSYTDGNGTPESLTSAAAGPIANVNDAPAITSDGGTAMAAVGVAENQTAVTTVTSSDVDGGVPAYTIIGGADAAHFAIDAASGALRFASAPDFEAPSDADFDNIYRLVVGVDDGNGGVATQTIAVAVSGINEAPGNIAPAAALLTEQASAGTVVAIVTASDPDAGDLFTFTLVNDGNGRFVIDPSSGRLTVAAGAVLDFETAPSHTLLLRVTDAQGLRTEQQIVVSLRDVAEVLPVVVPPAVPTTPLPPAVVFEPAPAPPLPLPPTNPAPATERESAGGRDVPEAPASRGLVGAARAGAQHQDEDAESARRTYGRPLSDDAPLVVASVSFNVGGSAAGGWSDAVLDGLLMQQVGDGQAPRFGLLNLRGSSLETEAGDEASARGRSAQQALAAAVQDPVRVASATLTAGFVWWLTRSGGLLTSILMGIPAWRHVDLLPVLAPRADDDDEDDESGDGDKAQPDARDSIADEMFSNTSRMFGESRYTS